MEIPQEAALLNRLGVGLLLDVGANVGQTGLAFRAGGYTGRMISFEPIAENFARLAQRAAGDPLWEVQNLALGQEEGPAPIGVSQNRVSSSLLPASDALVEIHAPVRYERQEMVDVVRLDRFLRGSGQADGNIHLKIDTQGFERAVIAGADAVLDRIGTIRMEVAVTEVYTGETTVAPMIGVMEDLGYLLIDAWPAWRHPRTGELLHFDLLFRRHDVPAVSLIP